MQRIASLAILVFSAAAAAPSATQLEMRQSDIIAVAVSGSSVTVTFPRPSGVDTTAEFSNLVFRLDCPLGDFRQVYIAGTAMSASSLSVTLGFHDPRTAAEFASCLDHRETARTPNEAAEVFLGRRRRGVGPRRWRASCGGRSIALAGRRVPGHAVSIVSSRLICRRPSRGKIQLVSFESGGDRITMRWRLPGAEYASGLRRRWTCTGEDLTRR